MATRPLKFSVFSSISSRIFPIFARSTSFQKASKASMLSYGCDVVPFNFQRTFITSSFPLRNNTNPIHLQRSAINIYSMTQQHNLITTNQVLSRLKLTKHTTGFSVRGITMFSKLGKRKTCKAVAKRFHRTGKGKLKRWRAGKNHNMMTKRNKRRKQLKKPTYVSKQQLKLLNKMLNGW